MTTYRELSLSCSSLAEDHLASLLMETNTPFASFPQDDGSFRVSIYVSSTEDTRGVIHRITERFTAIGALPPTVDVDRLIEEEAYLTAWRDHFVDVRIGRRFRIRLEEKSAPDDDREVTILIVPGLAFGTGTHPSTQLCLELIETHLVPGCSVLDVGTGSGILAVAAAKIGAACVTAVDNDQVAVSVARHTIAANDVEGCVAVEIRDIAALEGEDADLVVANLTAELIQCHGPRLVSATRCSLIAAGFHETDMRSISEALEDEAIVLVEMREKDGWAACVWERM